ncbi:hypothetical protein BDN72DRAFT_567236 [Pluteus cervinus]|uniref:Uncharacterized protein n=1 Tax=Pluteus cervinus TaxID=181527 RepID=A0ACD3A3D7_9AGAR|nr:hypothetical protein BDN72DRAFT_567236 [Pluteus cervinus]
MPDVDDTLENARAKIDAEILALQQRIRVLCSSRNALSLIHRLPIETMAEIFKWVQILYHGTLGLDGGNSASLPKWMQVTHVSQHWRNTALSSKALYSTILSQNPKYSEEIFKRSGSARLTLIDSVGARAGRAWDTPDFRGLVVAALPRVRKLCLHPKSSGFIFPLLKTSRLSLEELCLYDWNDFAPTMFPTSLRYLQLWSCSFESFQWLSPLSNMVELTIITTSHVKPISVDALLNALDAMPRLISLRLSILCKLAATPVNRGSPITPKLQHLDIRDHPDFIVQFLPWLSFAPRFTMNIFVHALSYSAADSLSMTFEKVGLHLLASSMVLHTAHFIWTPSNSSIAADISCFEEAQDKPCFRLHHQIRKEKDILRTWLEGAKVLPIGDVESLIMNAPCDVVDWSDGPWRSLPKLRQLVLHNKQASSTLIKYLIATADETDTPFESLEELSLYDVEYGRNLKSKFHAVLTGRMEKLGIKLRKLAFHNCGIYRGSMEQLFDVVDEVEVHGGTVRKR